MSSILHDLRYGARMLRKSPAFTAVVVLTLALGIGANSAMFGVIDALLFRPPSGVADPERIVRVRLQLPAPPGERSELSGVLSYPHFRALAERVRAFEAAAAYAPTSVTLGRSDEEGRSQPAMLVTGGYFPMLGVRPAAGRLLAPDDDRENAPVPVAVIGYDLWQRDFAGAADVLGRTIAVNERPFTIVGVAPKHFAGPDGGATALWVPLGTAGSLGFDERMIRSSFASWLSVIGRLADGTTPEQARASVQGALLAARDAGEAVPARGSMGPLPGGEVRISIGGPPGAGRGEAPAPRVQLEPIVGVGEAGLPRFGERRIPVSLWFLLITVAVLLIACANVANLLVARATQRAHEIAVRLSLGATRGRLVRQLVAEASLLALIGGIAGLAVAAGAVALLPAVIELPPLPPFLDRRVVLFTVVITLATIALFALVPAIRASRTDLQPVLSASGRSERTRSRGRAALVVGQLALSLVLLVGAGLFIRSFRTVRALDPGFAIGEMLIASVDLRSARFTREQAEEFWTRARERVGALPGVRSAALGAAAPFEMAMMMTVGIRGRPASEGMRPVQLDFADPGYFATLGIPVVAGRAFGGEDRLGSPPVAIVNEAFVRRYLDGAPALGQCLTAGPDGGCVEIVGVVRDATFSDVTQEALPFLYRPLDQRPPMAPPTRVLHVRTAGDPAALAGAIRRELQGLDPAVRFVRVRPTAELILPLLAPWRAGMLVLGLFGAVGLLLAAIGLYGVISFLVAQRTRELGVRLALGARRGDVLALIVRQAMRLVLLGAGLGIAVAAVASRSISGIIYGVSPLDPVVYAGMTIVLVAVALAAVLVPARRATAIDPMVALRAD